MPFLFLVFFIVGWIIPLFLAMSIWSEKGGSKLVGFLLGFALGWIGVLIAAVVTPTPTGVTWTVTDDAVQGETKTCPRCAETIKEAAVVCRFCGHEFEKPAVDPSEMFEGEAITEIAEHSFGIVWGKTAGGRTVFKEPDGDWRIWQSEETPLVPPNGYR